MSLWQGVDVPGDACQLVLIDKIPFPRPDDPLMQARKKAVDIHAAAAAFHAGGGDARRASARPGVRAIDPSRRRSWRRRRAGSQADEGPLRILPALVAARLLAHHRRRWVRHLRRLRGR